jgi:U32 family peptidase
MNIYWSSEDGEGRYDGGQSLTHSHAEDMSLLPSPLPARSQTIELLAPAGDETCADAAIENGADAIYFGLDSGFNARARAKNFGLDDLDKLVSKLHRRGVLAYVTMNTLVFASELEQLTKTVERIAISGVDAILVQDLGIAKLVRELCPQLHVHASTQMTMTSAETIAVAERLGLSRVVLARELSVDEFRKISASTQMPLEAFVHGALCVAYSGQCLTSESLGGRSANRGQCAQACRLPYELICDGVDRELGDVKYLLSPQDLAGYAQIPDLIGAGICSFKIEGRLKTPEYVANITSHYRQAIDAALAGRASSITDDDVREMEMSFSRGFTPGWLAGNDHKRLVPGTESAKRGALVGKVVERRRESVIVSLNAPVKRGDGIAFDGDRLGGSQQGGRIYEIRRYGHDVEGEAIGEEIELRFAHGAIDPEMIPDEARVWKSDDPALNKRLRASFEVADPAYRRPIDMRVHAIAGEPLRLEGTVKIAEKTFHCTVSDSSPLAAARNRPASESSLREQLERLGGTPFLLGDLDADIQGAPMVPSSLLNQLRRSLVEAMQTELTRPPARTLDRSALPRMLKDATANEQSGLPATAPELRVLCRTLEQVTAAADFGIARIYVDLHDIRGYKEAVEIAHARGRELYIASVRIQKPGEQGLLKVLLRHSPDGYLVRNLAALDYFASRGHRVVGDFSLNVVNPLAAKWLVDQGCDQVTASYDLNREQLIELIDSMPAHLLEVVIHQHMPMFHMEHCVFCSVLSPGTNKTNCGRPCDRHVVQLRDRVGAVHPLHADVACRNTLYNAVPQSGAEAVPEMITRGIKSLRIELLDESTKEVHSTLETYTALIKGKLTGRDVWTRLKAANRVGVTRGTLESARNPLAII